MTDQITYRTTDNTRWGAGQGTPLSKSQIDINFWVLVLRVLALEEHQLSAGAGIHDFYISPSNPTEFFVVLTDGTQVGPFSLPQLKWNFTNPPSGDWLPSFQYYQYDVFQDAGALYVVDVPHISSTVFDPNATDGSGHNLYSVLINISPIAAGGSVGQVLTKKSTTDYDTQWTWAEIASLHDVMLTSPLDDGQALVYSHPLLAWTNQWIDLSTLHDVTMTSLAAGDMLIYSGTGWVNITPELTTLGDVGLTSPLLDGSALVYDQTLGKFTNEVLSTTPALIRQSVITPFSATSGSVSIDPRVGDIFTVTPTNNITVSPSWTPPGARITMIITTSGTVSYNVTFGGAFRSTGVLATGVATAKVFTISFICDGSTFYETSRTAAM